MAVGGAHGSTPGSFRSNDLLAQLDAQEHRRYIKTHSPADCVPIFEECKYITVHRDGRDALMSWANHRGAMRSELVDFLNASALDEGLPPLPSWDGDMDELFDQWSTDCSPITHLASWWPLRKEGFAFFMHYNDLKADLEGEMRRLAVFLDIDVPEDLWPEAVKTLWSLGDARGGPQQRTSRQGVRERSRRVLSTRERTAAGATC